MITTTAAIVSEGICLVLSVTGNIIQAMRIKKLQRKLQETKVTIENLNILLELERKKREELKKQMWAWFWFFSKKQRELHDKVKTQNRKISNLQSRVRKAEEEKDLLEMKYEKVAT
jgi:hypothetical protein